MACTPKPIRRRTKKFKVTVEKARRAQRRRTGKNRMILIDEAWTIPDHNYREELLESIRDSRTFTDLRKAER